MIKNICFDMGGVLYSFSFEGFIRNELHIDGGEDFNILLTNVFRTVEWVRLDRGTLTDDEALEIMLPRIPERLHKEATVCVREWGKYEYKYAIPGMADLVKEVKAAGYNIYLFSNASLSHHNYWPPLPLAPLFEGKVMLSADYKIIKPSPEFFTTGAEKFNLNPAECVFIDDNPGNAEGAMIAGFNGIPFYGDAKRLRRELIKLGVNVKAE